MFYIAGKYPQGSNVYAHKTEKKLSVYLEVHFVTL